MREILQCFIVDFFIFSPVRQLIHSYKKYKLFIQIKFIMISNKLFVSVKSGNNIFMTKICHKVFGIRQILPVSVCEMNICLWVKLCLQINSCLLVKLYLWVKFCLWVNLCLWLTCLKNTDHFCFVLKVVLDLKCVISIKLC